MARKGKAASPDPVRHKLFMAVYTCARLHSPVYGCVTSLEGNTALSWSINRTFSLEWNRPLPLYPSGLTIHISLLPNFPPSLPSAPWEGHSLLQVEILGREFLNPSSHSAVFRSHQLFQSTSSLVSQQQFIRVPQSFQPTGSSVKDISISSARSAAVQQISYHSGPSVKDIQPSVFGSFK